MVVLALLQQARQLRAQVRVLLLQLIQGALTRRAQCRGVQRQDIQQPPGSHRHGIVLADLHDLLRQEIAQQNAVALEVLIQRLGELRPLVVFFGRLHPHLGQQNLQRGRDGRLAIFQQIVGNDLCQSVLQRETVLFAQPL